MNPASIVIVLAIVWGAITGTFTGLNLLLGAAIGGVAVLLLRSAFAPPRILRKIGQIASLILLFLYELAASAVRVAIVVLTPSMKADLRPAIIAFPLTVKSDAEITLLANLITLTPGTLSIDVSEDRSVLFVHVLTLSTREALIADIAGGFEAKVREIYS
ncbi:MAG: Na+/H+ antiporter subunit E [Devosia sp.]|jgi:multicomponent Na+:H+ antiporter subunit E|uniref:Na+/H+ antiporter subunit E n=1 Tax=Devosia sp. XGJD_8 TaxID=3391187 RepID=UPI0039327859